MSEKINIIVTDEAIKELDRTVKLVQSLAAEITKVNTVSGSNNYSNLMKEQALETKKAADAIKLATLEKKSELEIEIKSNQAKRTRAGLTVQEKVDNQILLAQEKQQAIAVSSVAKAYQKLNNDRAIAKNHLRDLIAAESKNTAEVNRAQKAFDLLDQKVRKADKAVGDMSKNVGNYKSAFSGLSNLMGAFGIGTGIYLAVDIAKNIYETTKALQSLDLALKMVSGSTEEFASNQAFITATAEKWGVEIKTLTEQYTYFYTAAKGLMSTAEIKTTFEGIAKAGAVMGLSLEKQSAAFYAFEQMMSKGIVTSEELKKQLGNSMPGAIRAAAMAYQELHPQIKTIQEAEMMLLKEMKRGAIDSATYVPLIVKNLEKLYGIEMVDKVETLQAAQNRLKNSWTDLVRSLNDSKTGGLTVFITGAMSLVGKLIKKIAEANTEWSILQNRAQGEGRVKGQKEFTKDVEKIAKTGGDVDDVKAFISRNRELANKQYINTLSAIKGELANITAINGETVSLTEALENTFTVGLTGRTIDDYKLAQTNNRIIDLKNTLGYWEGRLKGGSEEIQKINTPLKKDGTLVTIGTGGGKSTIKDKRDSIESVGTPIASRLEDTALERLKLLKAALEKTRDETSKTASEFKKWDDILVGVNGAIDQFTKPLTTDILPELEDKVKRLNNEAKQTEQIAKDLEKAISDTFNMFAGDFADRLGFTDSFDFLLGGKDGESLFDKLKEGKEGWKDYALAVTTIAQDMYNFLNQKSQQRFDAEYKRLDEQKEAALKNAGDSATAKEKIEEDFEKKKRQIANREAKAKKEQAMFNIAIDTAQAIMSAAPKVPLMIAMGVMGAIQIAMVAAQKIPQYWRGTKNAPEGLALTNEKGAEIHTDRHGNIKDFGHNQGATLTKMDAGDIVYTAEESRRMMFENEYKGLLRNNGISGAKPSNGMTASEMKQVMVETLGGRPTLNMNFDKGGFGTYISKNGNITRQSESRGSGRGIEI